MPIPAWLVSPVLALIRPHLEDAKREVLERVGQGHASREEIGRAIAATHERLASLEVRTPVLRLVHTLELSPEQLALLRELVAGPAGEPPGVSPPAPSDEDVVRAEANAQALEVGVWQILDAAADQGVSLTDAQARAYAQAALAGSPLPAFPTP